MRMTKKVFLDLAIYMIGFGLIIGIVFPLFTYVIGIPAEYLSNYLFIIGCIVAGVVVGVFNVILVNIVVGKRLNILSTRMQYVNENLKNSDNFDDEDCLKRCHIPVDSDDVIGESANSFNELVKSFLTTLKSESSIRKFTEIFTNELDLEKLSKKALEHIIDYTNSSAGVVLIDKGGKIEVSASHLIKNTESLLDMEIVHKSFSNNQQIKFNFPNDIKIEAGLLEFYPKAILIEPISYKNEVLGLVLLASTNEYKDIDINQLNVYTHGLSLGMHNAIIHDKLEQLAVLDSLTKIYNRRFGMERFKEEYSRSVRTNNPLGVLMFDIDHFKKINDTYGHIIGDQVLINFTNIISKNLRKGDVLVRYGGEEFMALLPGSSTEGTCIIAEKIRRIIEENKIVHGNQEIKITVSIGGTSFPENNTDNTEELIKIADDHLYNAKALGRNQTVCK
ncbi:hypothetical protein CI105_03455 [Candidatus Izimaplasma bacterium ZiA1]|uniref:sensor domain-containing diguanylate cyclase n=1 Tax=Candidatus Izimoplasma sp. ZiA1 TaxID=2024899 RepID=UPI000BAA6A8D|nr:hypothetical protein CI105_03455 [Candidatus Izimaplasma bacterium ZiA1]